VSVSLLKVNLSIQLLRQF